MVAGVGEFEKAAQQFLGGLADQDAVRAGQRLQPRGEIGRFTDDGALLRHPGADDFADHDEAGGDTDPRLHARAIGHFDGANFRQNADRGANRALCRVLEGAGKTEIGQYAIAHELGDETAIASDHAGHRVLVSPDQPAKQFRIELRRQRRRADHIDEHHGHLPPLGIAGAGFGRGGGCLWQGRLVG